VTPTSPTGRVPLPARGLRVQLEYNSRFCARGLFGRCGDDKAQEEISVVSASPGSIANRAQFHIGGARPSGYLEGHSPQALLHHPLTHLLAACWMKTTLEPDRDRMRDPRRPRLVRSRAKFSTNENEVQLPCFRLRAFPWRSDLEWCAGPISGSHRGCNRYGAPRQRRFVFPGENRSDRRSG